MGVGIDITISLIVRKLRLLLLIVSVCVVPNIGILSQQNSFKEVTIYW
jgi:hypothetical protein